MRAASIVGSLVLACAWAASAVAQPAPGQTKRAASISKEPAWLGVYITAGMRGVYVQEVIDDSPAARAGLDTGDEVVAVAGEVVRDPTELIAAVGRHAVGDAVVLAIWRDGRAIEREAILDAKPTEEDILHRRLVGKRAPDVRAPAVNGDAVAHLAALRGRVVVLLFAATRCDACATLHRTLSRFVDRNADRDALAFVLSREPRPTLAEWARRHRPSFVVLHDIGGVVASRYYVSQEPTVVVIDRDGEVLYVGIGGEDRLNTALAAAERALSRGMI